MAKNINIENELYKISKYKDKLNQTGGESQNYGYYKAKLNAYKYKLGKAGYSAQDIEKMIQKGGVDDPNVLSQKAIEALEAVKGIPSCQALKDSHGNATKGLEEKTLILEKQNVELQEKMNEQKKELEEKNKICDVTNADFENQKKTIAKILEEITAKATTTNQECKVGGGNPLTLEQIAAGIHKLKKN